jgi:hypothetical protein
MATDGSTVAVLQYRKCLYNTIIISSSRQDKKLTIEGSTVA